MGLSTSPCEFLTGPTARTQQFAFKAVAFEAFVAVALLCIEKFYQHKTIWGIYFYSKICRTYSRATNIRSPATS